MQSFDHYPHANGTDPARPTTLHDANSLASAPPIRPPLPARVKFGDFWICTRCQMAQEWCGCAKQRPIDATPQDGAESSLERRARECMGGR